MSALIESVAHPRESAPPPIPVRHGGRRRPVVRRPADPRHPPRRPRPVLAPSRVAPVACGRPPLPGWVVTVAIGAFVALFVFGFGLISGMSGVGAPVPETTRVIYVQPGQSVWSIARDAAPDSAPEAVVRRIGQLNALRGAAVYPGEALRVPDARSH